MVSGGALGASGKGGRLLAVLHSRFLNAWGRGSEWKKTTAHPILMIVLEIFRTFDTEILKIFKKIQPQPKT